VSASGTEGVGLDMNTGWSGEIIDESRGGPDGGDVEFDGELAIVADLSPVCD
jgi:hypothetical protein